MRRTTGAILFVVGLLLARISPSGQAQTGQTPTKELIQYVKDARSLGLNDSKIKEHAVKAGWQASVVEAALAIGNDKDSSGRPEPAANKATHSGKKGASGSSAASVAATDTTNPAAGGSGRPREPANVPESELRREHGVTEDYRIGAGDVLQISVWKEPDASVPSVVVRPDGRIAMPLLKEVEVVGMTPREAEKIITERLSKFISGVDVTVVVAEINSKRIYLIGAVKKEGPIPYTYRMSVMQAISEAGGLTDYAKRKKIYVLRRESGKDYRLPFNYDEVLKGERMEQNIQILPNDTIVVPH